MHLISATLTVCALFEKPILLSHAGLCFIESQILEQWTAHMVKQQYVLFLRLCATYTIHPPTQHTRCVLSHMHCQPSAIATTYRYKSDERPWKTPAGSVVIWLFDMSLLRHTNMVRVVKLLPHACTQCIVMCSLTSTRMAHMPHMISHSHYLHVSGSGTHPQAASWSDSCRYSCSGTHTWWEWFMHEQIYVCIYIYISVCM